MEPQQIRTIHDLHAFLLSRGITSCFLAIDARFQKQNTPNESEILESKGQLSFSINVTPQGLINTLSKEAATIEKILNANRIFYNGTVYEYEEEHPGQRLELVSYEITILGEVLVLLHFIYVFFFLIL